MPFGDACMAEGVQPIVGTMLGVARPGDIGPAGAIDWLALLAQDEAGYDNLCRLVSAAHLDRPVEEEPHVAVRRAGRRDRRADRADRAAGKGALARLLADGQADKAGSLCRQAEGAVPGSALRRAGAGAAIRSRRRRKRR